MKAITIDPRQSGISGDMLLSSLTDLFNAHDYVNTLIRIILNEFPNVKANYIIKKETRNNFAGTFLTQDIEQDILDKSVKDLTGYLSHLYTVVKLSLPAQKFVSQAIEKVILAEATVHGKDPSLLETLHFHELNSIDTLIDFICVAAILDYVKGWDLQILSYPVSNGNGFIKFSHGEFALPGPAVTKILELTSYPSIQLEIPYELTTPTGIALLTTLSSKCINSIPLHKIQSIGIGHGNQDLKSRQNFLRCQVIELQDPDVIPNHDEDEIMVLETHVDDVTGETLGYVFDELTNEKGILDVSMYPLIMKKNRPGYCIRVLAVPESVEEVTIKLIKLTGTLGVRIFPVLRHKSIRDFETHQIVIVSESYPVRIKIARHHSKIISIKPEYEDLKKIAKITGLSLDRLRVIVEANIKDRDQT